jgi:acetyl-CoA synthetase
MSNHSAEESSEAVGPVGNVVWIPSEVDIEHSNIEKFRQMTGEASLASLTERAKSDPDWFWRHVCMDLGIDFKSPPTRYYQPTADASRPNWCMDAQMNIVTSCLDKWLHLGFGDKPALRYESESGTRTSLSYKELLDRVCRATAGLRRLGVKSGDVVAVMMPMEPNTVVAMLAIARCGAIALPLFSGFGRQAIASRVLESGASVAIVKHSVLRRNKPVPIAETFFEAAALPECASLRSIVIDTTGVGMDPSQSVPSNGAGGAAFPACTSWRDAFDCDFDPADGEPAIGSAEDPLLLIFTSGTTGKPKGAIHSHCGFPIKAAQDMRHSMDLGSKDTFCWVTDIGWMMGPWAIYGALIGGMTLALFDGAPDYPDSGRLWRFVRDHKVTFFGLSPALARMMRTARDGVDTSSVAQMTTSLRAIGSTGSPWDYETWMWIFVNALQSRRPILNYSGGTEISGGILCGNMISPLKPCSFSGPVLGMDADVFDSSGRSVKGKPGELVLKNHWIGMTRGFWKNDSRYQTTYWERFPGCWTHGDYALIDEDGLWYITGRSDDTIKVAGKRLGPAEVETLVNQDVRIRECAAIGVTDEIKGECLVVFCVPSNFTEYVQQGAILDQLKADVRRQLVEELGKPLAPKEVCVVRSLPKTRNAKIMHRVLRAAYEGQSLGDLSSLEDQAAIEDVRHRL